MENTSYALYIAVGVLIAIVSMSVLLFSWRRIGIAEKSKDESTVVKNMADFNAEYLVYQKNLMYGSDVLSCLNKAQNNNQKYVYNNYYGTGGELEGRKEFFIDVEVTIKSGLSDSIKAYYKDSTGKYKRCVGLGLLDNATYQNNYNQKISDIFNNPKIYYYYFEKGKLYQNNDGSYMDIMWNTNAKEAKLFDVLKNGVAYGHETPKSGLIYTKMTANTYHLLTSEDTSTTSHMQETAKLAALISTITLKEQIVNNPETPTVSNNSDWWYCSWTTAASDFKSRKFKCLGVEYDSKTGYINKISFEEINNF